MPSLDQIIGWVGMLYAAYALFCILGNFVDDFPQPFKGKRPEPPPRRRERKSPDTSDPRP